jgi:GT2 family glycosyltransferase
MSHNKLNPLPLSIVILSYNLIDDLKKNLTYFINSRAFKDEYEIIVVDNNSKDGSKEFLMEMQIKFPELKLVLHNENKGCGAGRNSGWEVAQHEYILAIDHDAFISIDHIRRVPQFFEDYPSAGILGFKIIHQVTRDLQNPHGEQICEIANHHGAGFALRRKIFQKIGGNDDEVEYGADELDFSIKVYSDGWKILYIPEIVVLHNNIIRDKKEELYRANGYLYGNIRLLYKYFPKRIALRNGARYLIIASRVWFINFGISSFIIMYQTYIKARREGLSRKQTISQSTIDHYDNYSLRPEFGNVPIHLKIYSYLKKRNVYKQNKS